MPWPFISGIVFFLSKELLNVKAKLVVASSIDQTRTFRYRPRFSTAGFRYMLSWFSASLVFGNWLCGKHQPTLCCVVAYSVASHHLNQRCLIVHWKPMNNFNMQENRIVLLCSISVLDSVNSLLGYGIKSDSGMYHHEEQRVCFKRYIFSQTRSFSSKWYIIALFCWLLCVVVLLYVFH